MKAIVYEQHGEPDQLHLAEVQKPKPARDEVLVKVAGVGLNPVDLKILKGFFSTQLQFPFIPGSEFSGTVEEVGEGVNDFAVGDAVFGLAKNTLAEYVCAGVESTAKAPASLDLPTAGVVPVAAMTAWQDLHDQAGIKAGDRVLIHAAAGGVGTFAVQIAKETGAYVIGTAGPENHHYLERLGADEVIDYRSVKFEDAVSDIDIVLDLIGGDGTVKNLKVMKKGAILIGVNGPFDTAPFENEGKRAIFWSMKPNRRQLDHIRDMIEDVKLNVVVSDQAHLDRTREGFEVLAKGHVKGKLLVIVDPIFSPS